MMPTRRLVDKAAGLNGCHLVGIVDVGVGARCYPPGSLENRDISRLVMVVRPAARAWSPRNASHVDAWLTGISDDRDRSARAGGLQIFGMRDEKSVSVRGQRLTGGRGPHREQRNGRATDPLNRTRACHDILLVEDCVRGQYSATEATSEDSRRSLLEGQFAREIQQDHAFGSVRTRV